MFLVAGSVVTPNEARGQSPDWLSVHAGALTEAPSALPLQSRELALTPTSGTANSYSVEVPASVKGVTLVVEIWGPVFGGIEVESASGDKLNPKGWSVTKRMDGDLAILSFDGLKRGVNRVRIKPSIVNDRIVSISVNRAAELHDTATLTALSLSSGGPEKTRTPYGLTPAFRLDRSQYSVKLEPDQGHVVIQTETEPWWGHVEVQGTAPDGAPLLVESNNAVNVPYGTSALTLAVVAEDGSTASTYSLSVTREAPTGDATLHALELWQSAPSRSLADSAAAGRLAPGDLRLSPQFAADIDRYTARTTASSLLLRAKVAPLSTVTAAMSHGRSSSFDLSTDNGHFYGVTLSGLEQGANDIQIRVKADGGNRQTVRLDVERFGSVATPLRALHVQNSDGKARMLPKFDPATLDYIVTMSGSEVSIQTEADPELAVNVSGKSASGTYLLDKAKLGRASSSRRGIRHPLRGSFFCSPDRLGEILAAIKA